MASFDLKSGRLNLRAWVFAFRSKERKLLEEITDELRREASSLPDQGDSGAAPQTARRITPPYIAEDGKYAVTYWR